MVIHSLLLRSLHPHTGKGRGDQAIDLLPLLGRVGLMVMVIHICLFRISYPLLGKGGVVAMVIHSLLLRGSPPHLEKRKG